MKIGIRTKLIMAFVLVILVPIINTFLMMGFVINRLNRDPDIVKFNSLNRNFQRVIGKAEDNFYVIHEFHTFDGIIGPIAEEFDGRVRVMDLDGVVLYDSSKSDENGRSTVTAPDGGVFNLTRYSYTTEIERGEETLGTITIDYDINLMPSEVARKVILYFSWSYIFGLLSMVIVILLFSRSISRSILIPLNELSRATENIASGNLDFSIEYSRNNEFGRFCKAFDGMREELKTSIEKQAESERQRKELLGSISHDLRTPISSIKGYVEALQDGIARDEEQFERYLEVIRNKTHRLDTLIDDLFQFSKMDMEGLKMDYEITDSKAMLKDMLSTIALDWEDSHIKIIEKSPFPSVKIRVDKKRISQVMDNIIQNASRYVGHDGRIEIGTQVKGEEFLVSVRDNGLGIGQEDIVHIFEPFYRGEKSRSRDYGGTGMGLAICKRIIEDHGGKIWAESLLGEGTTIFFSLPII